MKINTSKFRLFIIISVLWLIITILIVTSESEYYWRFSDYAIPIFLITLPVWIFWSGHWIWPDKFAKLFGKEGKKSNPYISFAKNLERIWKSRKQPYNRQIFTGSVLFLVGLIAYIAGVDLAYLLFPVAGILIIIAFANKMLN